MSKFPDFAIEPDLTDFRESSLAWLIQRFIERMRERGRSLGPTHTLGLRAWQRRKLGAKTAAKLTKKDIIAHCEQRIASGVMPSTVGQDISFLRGVLRYAPSDPDWDDCEDISDACIAAALPYLRNQNLVAKSGKRTRRPSEEEIKLIVARYREQAKHPRTTLGKRMPDMIEFALISTRRISEICRMTWGDIDFGKKVYWVRDVKHPTKKLGNHKCFILWPAIEAIIRRQPRTNPGDPNERIFPVNSKSASTSYCDIKRKLGIEDLHFHDNRADGITRWKDKGLSSRQVRLGISGHDTEAMVDQVYDRGNALDMTINDETVAAMLKEQQATQQPSSN